MKNYLRKLLLAVFIVAGSFAAYSGSQFYKATNYSIKYNNGGSWSSWLDCSINIILNVDDCKLTIYSKETQRYRITKFTKEFYDDSGTYQLWFLARDPDDGLCRVRFAIRTYGRMELYIEYNDFTWGYIIVEQ